VGRVFVVVVADEVVTKVVVAVGRDEGVVVFGDAAGQDTS
jgi:hypothetical protein